MTSSRAFCTALAALAAAHCWGCGQSGSDEVATRTLSIIGGERDTTHTGVVALVIEGENGSFGLCSGTLLTPNLVLTAQHCVAPLSMDDSGSIACDQTVFQATRDPLAVRVSVEEQLARDGLPPYVAKTIWMPPGGNTVCGRDLALVLLSGTGVASSLATPIEPALSRSLSQDDTFTAVGYGRQRPDDARGESSGNRISFGPAKVLCNGGACRSDTVTEGELVAESPSCLGDSGGPALDRDGHVSAVVSRGPPECDTAIYESVQPWRDFIIEKTLSAALQGRYEPPAWAGDSPLGQSCTGPCASGFQCWAENGESAGVCVPTCSASDTTCPESYRCEQTQGVCAPISKPPERDSGCGVSGAHSSGAAAWLSLLLLSAWTKLRARPKPKSPASVSPSSHSPAVNPRGQNRKR